jgi:VIT1/CCC1 family predicted Fe2+/Mn2+ transporter
MILSTSTRLGRVVDRVRALSDRLQLLPDEDAKMEHLEEKRAMIYDQLDKLTSRSRLLQRGLTTFYLAVGVFVATSVAIGVVSFFNGRAGWVPVALGLVGASFLFYGSMLLVFEARLALSTTHAEMDFIWRTTKRLVPRELVAQHKAHYVHFRKPKD